MSINEASLQRLQARPNQATARRGKARFVFTPTGEPCGVENFTRTLLGALSDSAGYYAPLPVSGRWRELPFLMVEIARSDQVIFNFPLVAWKRMLIQPLLLLIVATITRRRVNVFLHEWAALHWLRRIFIIPFLSLANSILVVSPYIGDQLANSLWAGLTKGKVRLLPHPPTIRRPQSENVTERVREVALAASQHDVVIGTFGAIYRGKSSIELLDVCASMNRRNIRTLLVFIGSFTRALDDYESEFHAAIKQKGLEEHVVVSGYVAEEDELFALFEGVGAFLFLFPEGLTARRSSVIACLQSNRPVVVSEPHSMTEFDHHAGWKAVIKSGALNFVPPKASAADISELLLAATKQASVTRPGFDSDAWWRATTEAAHRALGAGLPETVRS